MASKSVPYTPGKQLPGSSLHPYDHSLVSPNWPVPGIPAAPKGKPSEAGELRSPQKWHCRAMRPVVKGLGQLGILGEELRPGIVDDLIMSALRKWWRQREKTLRAILGWLLSKFKAYTS